MKAKSLKTQKPKNSIAILLLLPIFFFTSSCESVRLNKIEHTFIKNNIIGKRTFEDRHLSSALQKQFLAEHTLFSKINSSNRKVILLQGLPVMSHGSFARFYIVSNKTEFERIKMPLDSVEIASKLDSLNFRKSNEIINRMNHIYNEGLKRQNVY